MTSRNELWQIPMPNGNEMWQAQPVSPNRSRLAMAWTAIILVLCLLPGSWLPRPESGGATPFPHHDKLIHATLFFGFGLLWMCASTAPQRRGAILVAGLLLAVGTELLQGLSIVERDPDLLDGVADLVGTILAIGIFSILPSWFRVPAQPPPDPLPSDGFEPEVDAVRNHCYW